MDLPYGRKLMMMMTMPESPRQLCGKTAERGDNEKRLMSTVDNKGNKEGEDDESWDIPEPPDGGWGWVVMIASFLCNMVVDGIAYSFGIFLMEFVQYYGSAKGRTAWIGSLLAGCYLSTGPIVSALTNRFGCRRVTMAGSVFASASFILSTFAPNVDILMLTYGIMGGIGFGLIYLPAIVTVSYYFSTKRALATGIAVCGSGTGAFVFAPVCQFLLTIYDWKGALTILAGVTLNCMVFGALMRPLDTFGSRKIENDKKEPLINHNEECRQKTKHGINTEPGVQSRLDLDQVNKNTEQKRTQFITLSSMGEGVKPLCHGKNGTRKLSLMQLPSNIVIVNPEFSPNTLSSENARGISRQNLQLPAEPITSSIGNLNIQHKNRSSTVLGIDGGRRSSRRCSLADGHRHAYRREYCRPIYRKDIFFSGSITTLAEYTQSQRDMQKFMASVTSLPVSTKEELEKTPCVPPSITNALKEMLNFQLLKNPAYLLLCISNVFGMMGFYIPFVYITDSSILKGIQRNDAVFILSIIGIINTIGRIIFGWVGDRPKVNSLWVNNACLFLSGLSVLCIPFCYTYTTVVISSTLFGLFISAYMCLTSIILVDLLGLDHLTNAFGLLSLFRGASSIVGPPIAGSIYDLTGSYQYPFFAAGAMLITSALLSAFVPTVKRLHVRRKRKHHSLPQFIETLPEEPEDLDSSESTNKTASGM